MNSGMFYRSVRSLVTAAAIFSAAPAFAMAVDLGDVIQFTESTTLYRVIGAKVVDVKHVELDLEAVNSGVRESVTIDRSRSLEDVPGLIVIPQGGGRGLTPQL